MSKAEQIQRLDPWNAATSASEAAGTPGVSSCCSEEDQVTWPPVIARIRDLDKPAVRQSQSVDFSPATPTKTLADLVGPKVSSPRRKGQNLPSQLIVLVGIIIFLMAIVPFLPFRNGKSGVETVATPWQPLPPASTSELSPPWTAAGTATLSEPTAKTSSQPIITLSNTAANDAKAAPPAPQLLLSEKKKPSEDIAANPTPGNMSSTPFKAPAIAPHAGPQGISSQNPASCDPNLSQPNAEAQQFAENAESTPWNPPALPQQITPMTAENQRYPASPESSTILPPKIDSYGAPATNPNQPMPPTANPSPIIADSPQANPQASWANAPPSMTIPNGEYRDNYTADRRNNVRPNWDRTPDYRKTLPISNPLLPSGQPSGQAMGQLLPSGGQVPSINVRQDTTLPQTPPQMPQQYNPTQPKSPISPMAQPAPGNAAPYRAANTWQNGGYPPPPPYNNNSNTVAPGTSTSPAGYPEGYSIPATSAPSRN